MAGNRTSVTYLLQLNFGDTFTPGAHFYDNPDFHQFTATLLHVAINGCVGVNAKDLPDTRQLFYRKTPKGMNYVDEDELHQLGCTKSVLFELLKRLPGADPKHRHADAAPLVLPVPVLAPREPLSHGSPSLSHFPSLSPSPSPSPSPRAAALDSRCAAASGHEFPVTAPWPDVDELFDSVDWAKLWAEEHDHESLLEEPFAQYLCADDDAALEDSLMFDRCFNF